LHQYYKTGPGHYIGHLIGHEGKGSLLSELKAKGWVNSLVGGQKTGSKGFGFFIVNIDLTVEGQEHVDDIVTLVFQYLRMLREAGPLEWIFDECKNLNAMQYRFKDKERPQSYTCGLASSLHEYPVEESLSGPYMLTEWRPELITKLLDNLVPEKMAMTIISQKFKDVATESEKWYGTKYKTEPIPSDKIAGWSTVDLDNKLHLPEKNEFIPTQFDIVDRDEASADAKHPVIVRDTPLSKLWFKQDDEFLLPKACVNIRVRCPLAYHDPHHVNLTYMFVELLKDDLNEYTYAAELAGLYYGLGNSKVGFTLTLRGYNEKQAVLLEKILIRMTEFKVDAERFKVLKESYERALKNFEMEQPHSHTNYFNTVLLSERSWEKGELLDEMDGLTVDAVQEFIPRLLAKVHVEALMHGNLTEQSALAMLSSIEARLSSARPLTLSQLTREREVALEANTHSVYSSVTKVHKSSCIETYYQCGMQETRSNVIIELFSQIINEPCFNILRTKEQLGYIVFSGVRRACGVQGLRVIVQSERHPEYLDDRIEAFLHSMEEHLEKMDEDEFERNKTALADRKLEKPKKLSTRTNKFWSEIVTQQYNFDRDQVEVDELRKLTKDDLLVFYRNSLCHKSDQRRKLSCHIVSMAEDGAGSKPKEAAIPAANDAEKKNGEEADLLPVPKAIVPPTAVEDAVAFRSSLPLHRSTKPFTNPKTLVKGGKAEA
jgi:insulysin